MEKKAVSGILLTLLLTSMLTFAFNIQPVKASGAIYIRADGSIDPPTAPISTVDNVTYTFTDNINESIVIQRGNIIVNGAGYTLQGSGGGDGFYWHNINNITIKNTKVKGFYYGIYVYYSSYNSISGNNITNNVNGICLYDSSSNNITGNNMANNGNYEYGGGIFVLLSSEKNIITGNMIASNGNHGICVTANNNTISENNVINNGVVGIGIEEASFSVVSDNNVTGNGYGDPYGVGILIGGPYWAREYGGSHGNVLSGNAVADNHYDFDLWGENLQSLDNHVDTSNTVDGKPIYYWINETDKTVPQDAGYVALVNCSRIRVENLSLTRNGQGILLASVTDSTITKNNITDNYYGVMVFGSSRNLICYNNLVNNTIQAGLDWSYLGWSPSLNNWDNGYPSGGNYWSDYSGLDGFSGPYQNETGSDGIGDVPCVIDENNTDHYPLLNPTNGIRPSPSWHLLTIKTLVGGITNPAPGIYAFSVGEIAFIEALPDTDYGFDHWELEGINIGASNPLSVTMNSNHLLRAIFNYNVTIGAHCDVDDADLNVSIWMDGLQTNYTTPHAFTRLVGTHTFGISGVDPHGHRFYQWNTDVNRSAITVTSPGTYIGHYRQTVVRFRPQNIAVSRGQLFTVAVVIENVSDLYGFDLQITWDPTWLKYVDYTVTIPVETYPGGLLHGPIMKLKDVVNENGGIPNAEPETRAWIAYASNSPAPSFNGSGSAFTMTFRTLNQTGMTTLNFTSIKLADHGGYPIRQCVSINGDVEVLGSYVFYDVAITNITSPKTVVGQGYPIDIDVTVENYGNFTETFNVTLYAQSQTTINETGLVGYWNFDEGTGTVAYDSSGNNNHGTLVNEPQWVEGKIGKALSFDGLDDYIEITPSTSLNNLDTNFTIEAWIKVPTDKISTGYIVNLRQNDNDPHIEFYVNHPSAGQLGAHFLPSDSRLAWSIGINDGAWHHVVLTGDNGVSRLYKDGVVYGSTGSCSGTSGNWDSVSIGRSQGGEWFNGTIDEVKIYNRALSADEVWAEYTRTGATGALFLRGTQTITLESGASTTITFTWNTAGFAKGNYTISVVADSVPGETYTADNTLVGDFVFISIPGDIAEPYLLVDIFDVVKITGIYEYTSSMEGYEANSDINGDGIIDIFDVVACTSHYEESW